MPTITSRLVCSGCGYQAPDDDPAPFRCPRSGQDERDHVLRRVLTADHAGTELLHRVFEHGEPNPFLRYRELLHSYRSAATRGLADADFVARVRTLDAAVAAIDGGGFRQTPFAPSSDLAAALGVRELWVKDETGNVSGSHKARHLAGIMLWLGLEETLESAPLAISSCGNAALGAAVVARAAGRDLEVFVPPHADPAVLERLKTLGSQLRLCPRIEQESGDPCYLRFREALAAGSLPFTCQGSENGLTIDGGKTLVWEIASTLASRNLEIDRLFVQVGGGALATACIEGLREACRLGVISRSPSVHAVQTEGAHPLERAYHHVAERVLERGSGEDRVPPREQAAERARLVALAPSSRVAAEVAHAAAHRADFIWPWENEPHSLAEGILDDETYDWLAVVEGMLESGGYPVTVSEDELREAHKLARRATGLRVDPTGTAGLAGALALSHRGELGAHERIAVLFTGAERSAE